MTTLDKYTHRGTERIVREPEPKNPTEAFVQRFGEDLFDRVTGHCWDGLKVGETRDEVTLLSREMQNASNYTYGVRLQIGALVVFMTFDCGDNDGTVVRRYGSDPAFAKWSHTRTFYRFEPHRAWGTLSSDQRIQVLKKWACAKTMHADKERQMNYDKLFASGSKTDAHYEAYAAKWNLRIVSETVEEQ